MLPLDISGLTSHFDFESVPISMVFLHEKQKFMYMFRGPVFDKAFLHCFGLEGDICSTCEKFRVPSFCSQIFLEFLTIMSVFVYKFVIFFQFIGIKLVLVKLNLNFIKNIINIVVMF